MTVSQKFFILEYIDCSLHLLQCFLLSSCFESHG